MGETVQFPSNGDMASGYLAVPPAGSGPGLLVLQEWWGLVPQLKRTCDRFAAEGFVALAPDLYHGELAEHAEMDKANELMNSLPPDRAARDMSAAIEFLHGHDAVTGKVGVTGFCMGGMLTLMIAALQGDRVGAAVPWYGAPLGEQAPDWSGLTAPVVGHFGEEDEFFDVNAVRQLDKQLQDLGKDVSFHYYPGAKHAFANEEEGLGPGHYDEQAANTAWSRTVDFLRDKLAA